MSRQYDACQVGHNNHQTYSKRRDLSNPFYSPKRWEGSWGFSISRGSWCSVFRGEFDFRMGRFFRRKCFHEFCFVSSWSGFAVLFYIRESNNFARGNATQDSIFSSITLR